MAFIDWNETPRVGISEIDEQHHHFIGILNKMDEIVKSRNPKKEEMDVYISDIMEYAGRHFITEERYFKKYDYPFATEHAQAHAKLLEDAIGFYDRFKAGDDVAKEFLLFLKGWLGDHLMKHDMKYAAYFRQIHIKEMD